MSSKHVAQSPGLRLVRQVGNYEYQNVLILSIYIYAHMRLECRPQSIGGQDIWGNARLHELGKLS